MLLASVVSRSVCLNVPTPETLDEFWLNFVSENFAKIRQRFPLHFKLKNL